MSRAAMIAGSIWGGYPPILSTVLVFLLPPLSVHWAFTPSSRAKARKSEFDGSGLVALSRGLRSAQFSLVVPSFVMRTRVASPRESVTMILSGSAKPRPSL